MSETSQYRILRAGVGLTMVVVVGALFWLSWRSWPIVHQSLWPAKLSCGCQVMALAVPPITAITAGMIIFTAIVLLIRFLFFFTRHIVRSRRQIDEWTSPGKRSVYHRLVGESITILTKSGRQAMTMGLFRPRVYITDDLRRSLRGQEVSAVLTHEQAHRRRYDQLWSALLDSFSAAWWRWPLIQEWVATSLTLRELSADAAATSGYRQTAGLSGAILKLAETRPVPGLISFSPNRDRVEKLLDHDWRPQIKLWRWSYVVVIGVAAVVVTAITRLTPPAAAAMPLAASVACQETRLLCQWQRHETVPLIFRCTAGSSDLCLPRWFTPLEVQNIGLRLGP